MVEPPPTHGYVVAEAFLGKPQVIAALREANPEVTGKLEELIGTMFKSLSLTAAHFMPAGDGTVLEYDAKAATEEFYSDPVAALRNAGVIKPDALVAVTQINAGQPSESKLLEAYFDGFELFIYVLKPDYQASRT